MWYRLTSCAVLLLWTFPATAWDWRGYVAGESRVFLNDPLWPNQDGDDVTVSLSALPELHHEWDDGYQQFVFSPFLRIDSQDDERTHWDIRELYWETSRDRFDLRVGVRQVFWGVTESQHLVDIINQTDLVENVDGEDKLGQPMVNLSLVRNWGTVDLFMLPGFRERTFPGSEGRLRPMMPIDNHRAAYESGAEESHVDWAARYSHSIGGWDFGLSHFVGTSRDPRFVLRGDGLRLVPYYDQINQTGADVQWTRGSWLWKWESIVRSGQGETFSAVTAGFEYTQYGIFGSAADLGVLAEYLGDSRGDHAATPFANDLFLGTRLALNDEQSTSLLAGGIVDLEGSGLTLFLEGSRRLGDSWRLNVEARLFNGQHSDDPIFPLHQDDHLQLELAWYF